MSWLWRRVARVKWRRWRIGYWLWGPFLSRGWRLVLLNFWYLCQSKVSSKHQVGRYKAVSCTASRVETYTLVALWTHDQVAHSTIQYAGSKRRWRLLVRSVCSLMWSSIWSKESEDCCLSSKLSRDPYYEAPHRLRHTARTSEFKFAPKFRPDG